jgi:hypothetical protein
MYKAWMVGSHLVEDHKQIARTAPPNAHHIGLHTIKPLIKCNYLEVST